MTVALIAMAVAASALVVVTTISARRARRTVQRFQILDDVAAVATAHSSSSETLEAITDVLVPQFADFCMIDALSEEGVERMAVRAGGERGDEIGSGLAERDPSIPSYMAGPGADRRLEPRFFERMSDEDLRRLAQDADDLEFLRGLGIRSAITVALTARGRLSGTLTLGVAWSGRRYRQGDLRFARVLAGRVALALDNVGLFFHLERAERSRAEIAETLQRGLLPPPLPTIPGWTAAALYRPAGAENAVGGDFYDAFQVEGGWLVVVGDVTGQGARAASITAQARYTLRTAAGLTGDPLVALDALNRALLARGDGALCTVAALSLCEDPTEPVRIAVAGHPPPLLVDGDRVEEAVGTGPVLGAFEGAEWALEHARVGVGRQLVIVTDGVIEASGPDGRFGEGRLRAALSGASHPAHAVQRLEGALVSFVAGKLEDDAAVIALSPDQSEGGDTSPVVMEELGALPEPLSAPPAPRVGAGG